ncbi:MAG: hypothetical protein V1710_05915 [Candidatus Bathyarchaeota archaeon]
MTGPYREQVSAPIWARGTLLAAFTMTAGLLTVQTLTGSMIGENPAPVEVLLTLSLIFGGVYLLFSRLGIQIDYHGVELRYGLIRRKIPYLDIERVELSNIDFYEYGGIGLKQNHRGDLAYSTRAGQAVKLVTRSGGPVLFTPQEPWRIVSLINEMGSIS